MSTAYIHYIFQFSHSIPMYISYIVLYDMHMMKLMYVYVQTLIMLLRLGMHTKDINKKQKQKQIPSAHELV